MLNSILDQLRLRCRSVGAGTNAQPGLLISSLPASPTPLVGLQAAEAEKMAQFKALLGAGPIQIAKRQ